MVSLKSFRAKDTIVFLPGERKRGELGASLMLGKGSIPELHSQPRKILKKTALSINIS